MKRSLNFRPKKLNFKPFNAKRVKVRLTNKFWFYKKYFRYAVFIKNFYLKYKIYYNFDFNLFRYSFYINWTKFFSKKYYEIFFDDIFSFNVNYIPPLVKYEKHLGVVQKYFFFKKRIASNSPIQNLYNSNIICLNKFFLINMYINFLKIYYRFIILIFFLKIKKFS